MDYTELVLKVRGLDFVHDEVTADAAVKAVMGILLSRMEESPAKKFAAALPQPLTFERLRARQERPIGISTGYYKAELCTQFGLSEEQTEELVHTVYHYLKENVSDEAKKIWESGLPEDWVELVRES